MKLKEENQQEKQRKKEEIEILKTKPSQDPSNIDFIHVDGVMKKINYKNVNKHNTVSLSQVLENGIWQMEVEFSDAGAIGAIGIVRDTYNIPEGAHPNLLPHRDHMVSYGMSGYASGKCFHYKGNGISGNIAFSDNQKIKAEFDSVKGTLIFFVDGVQQPVYILGIKEKVRFITYMGHNGSSCTIRSLKKLTSPTSEHIPNEKAINW
ncbi:MAG: hypothetical protein EZS28_047528 [Streblomastix strix]|uniref:B30.2/SPRY domain-containing protein n=1 Tax=Streblomastix strix TaxID=222440 RepID=A0A5J4THK4_9EUKA|nr:MAG: hypothetical protein EZS28_047528 [Streblomastix strix]